jgi:uncharacterized protein
MNQDNHLSPSENVSFSQFEVLRPYNPWWNDLSTAFQDAPTYTRDIFPELLQDITQLPQMVSVTGPRRVGKSTLLQQCIQSIIQTASESGSDPAAQAKRIVYFSMQDPALDLPGFNQDQFFNDLVATAITLAKQGTAYLFLDEVQRFSRWELYLKKYYDMKAPVRFIVSGSASTPIFRKSRESLLGRIKNFHVMPFSFFEWQRFDAQHTHINDYFFDGGFPEVWALSSPKAKQEYLYQNQVERVIFEDLLVAAEFRKPEMLRRFYIGLLRDPGRESNLAKVASDLGMVRSTIESYFPLLEATDLVWRLHKHTSTKATPKAGNFKTYLVDLAVRNAVLKLSKDAMANDPVLLGAYAENVVANHLRKLPGLVELGFWRQGDLEIDFIVDLGNTMIGVEVKYRGRIDKEDIVQAAKLAKQLKCASCVVVSKDAFDNDELVASIAAQVAIPVAVIALPVFLAG